MPLAGFTTTQGKLEISYVVLAGTLGSVLGILPWYYAGRYAGTKQLKSWADRYDRWLTLSGRDIDKANRWFYTRGGKTAVALIAGFGIWFMKRKLDQQ